MNLKRWTALLTAVCLLLGIFGGASAASVTQPNPVTNYTVNQQGVSSHTHDLYEYGRTNPTCTQSGVAVFACNGCRYTEQRTLPALGHSWSDWTVIKENTCKDDGHRTRVCTRCGAKDEDKPKADASKHNWGPWNTVQDQTCRQDGRKSRSCATCGKTEDQILPADASGHRWGKSTVLEEATCTEKGKAEHTCRICGKTATYTLKTKGHEYTEFTIITEATNNAKGKRVPRCINCGKEGDKEDYYPDGTKKKGDNDDEVEALQENLAALGYDLAKINGNYGEGTIKWVKRFQRDHGLKQDGIAWPETLEAIVKELKEKGIVPKDMGWPIEEPEIPGTVEIEDPMGGFTVPDPEDENTGLTATVEFGGDENGVIPPWGLIVNPAPEDEDTESFEIGETETFEIGETETFEIGETESFEIGETESFEIGETESFEIGETESFEIGETESFEIGETESFEIGETESFEIGETESFEIGETESFEIGETESFEIGETESFEIGETGTIEIEDPEGKKPRRTIEIEFPGRIIKGSIETGTIEIKDPEPVTPTVRIVKAVVSAPANGTCYVVDEEVKFSIEIFNDADKDVVFVVYDTNETVEHGTAAVATGEILAPGESKKYEVTCVLKADKIVEGKYTNQAYTDYAWADDPATIWTKYSDNVEIEIGEELKVIPPSFIEIEEAVSKNPAPAPADPKPAAKTNDSCMRSLKGMSGGGEEYTLHYCAEHYALLKETQALMDNQGSASQWKQAASAWKAEAKDLYDSCSADAGEAFIAWADGQEKMLAALLPDDDAYCAEVMARLYMNRATDLCYLIHNAPKDRPDSYVTGDYKKQVGINPGEPVCIRETNKISGQDATYSLVPCANHDLTDSTIKAALDRNTGNQTEFFTKACDAWVMELNALYTVIAGRVPEARSTIAKECNLFNAWLNAETEMLTRYYPKKDGTVAEAIYNDMRIRTMELCDLLDQLP